MGLNLKTLSNEQLLERSQELTRKIALCSRFSNSGGGLEALMQMASVFETETYERSFMQRWNAVEQTLNQPIESDPEMKNAALQKDREGNLMQKRASARSRPSMMKRPSSSAPTDEGKN